MAFMDNNSLTDGKKKNIVYLFQVSYLHENSTFLPYTACALVAYAKRNEEIRDFFDFKEPIFLRDNRIDDVVQRLQAPAVCAFSNYIWNHEYNKVLSRKIKERFPDCKIIFGGHQMTADTTLLETEQQIDFMIFGEGETTFAALLLALRRGTDLALVDNIVFRKDGKTVATKRSFGKGDLDYPSPYLTGEFDSLLQNHPDISFNALLETNRGCPYGCAYCDWGGGEGGKNMRFFPEEKVMEEIRWISSHNIEMVILCDSNFGMFERDERFVDEIVRLYQAGGSLKKFQTSYAKNSNDRVFSITKKLTDCRMNKGTTISFQSLCENVLENIHRKNIPIQSFSELMKKYAGAGIPTYSELILGLPGETLQSLVEGIDMLLESGQHNAIYVHNCEVLPFSPMGDKKYIDQYGIETVKIPINQPHCTIDDDEIIEFSHLVVQTNTMSKDDWVEMNLYSDVIQAFHNGGLLIFFALYLRYTQGLKYSSFYCAFRDYLAAHPETVAGRAMCIIKSKLREVTQAKASAYFTDARFGDVGWPPEEYFFLLTLYEADRFYSESKDFLKTFIPEDEILDELLAFQRSVIKRPAQEKIDFLSQFDFKTFFANALRDETTALEKKEQRYHVDAPQFYENWVEYARNVVWYGKKDSRAYYLEQL